MTLLGSPLRHEPSRRNQEPWSQHQVSALRCFLRTRAHQWVALEPDAMSLSV